jgi:DNA modification methylase
MKKIDQKLSWHTEQRKVRDLIPYEANPRKLTEEQARQLQKSIERFNLISIPTIDTDNKLVGGHQRIKTLHVLGRSDEVIDVRVPNRKLTDEEFKEINLRENKNTGEFDFDMLGFFDEEMLKDVGFSSKELDKITGDDEEEEDDFDEEEILALPPKSKYGDVYECGDHIVMCGDATKEEDVDKLLAGERAAMVFTDPPYNIDYQGGMNTHGQNKRKGIQNDKMSKDSFATFLDGVCTQLNRVSDGAIYICMSSVEIDTLKKSFEQTGGHFQSFIIWVKNTFTLSRSDWQNQYEPMLYGWPKGVKNHYFVNWRDEGNVWDDIKGVKPVYDGSKTTIKLGDFHLELDGEITGKICSKKECTDIWREKKPAKSDLHPTMKPIKLVAKAIKASSVRDNIVLDTFAGSGSTLIACEGLGRKCRTMELDPKYVDVIVARWEALTKLKAVKIK